MATPMTYDVILYDKENPELKLKYPMGGETAVCWYMLAQTMDELHWGDMMDTPVLDSLSYSFYLDNCALETVERLFHHFFGQCPYGVLYEITELSAPVNGCTHNVFMTGFGEMPRGLFMNKMFMIRNLIRDDKSTAVFDMLLYSKVPFPIAAYLGGGCELYESFSGDYTVGVKDYAGYFTTNTPFFIEMVRSMASNIYCEQKSLPWKEGWGYNKPKEEWGNVPSEINGSISHYQKGSNIPDGWRTNDLYEMTADQLTTLVRLICQDDTLTVTFP